MNVEFRVKEEKTNGVHHYGSVGKWGFNLIDGGRHLVVEIVDAIGKPQTYSSFDEEKKAVMDAYSNL